MPVITSRGGQVTQRGGLGLGLGLNKKQQQRVANAASSGDLTSLNPQLQAKVQNRLSGATGNAQQQANAQGLMRQPAVRIPGGGGAAPQPAAPTGQQIQQAAAPQGPAGGQPKGGGGGTAARQGGQSVNQQPTTGANTIPAAAAAPASAGASTPAYADVLSQQFGAGNPFGQRDYSTLGNDAVAQAQRELDKNLANIGARFGGMGVGNSSRAAMAQGEAAGQFGSDVARYLGEMREGAYQGDATRGLAAMTQAGQQDLMARQLGLQTNEQLMNAGKALTGIGASEMQIPNLAGLASLLSTFAIGQQGGGGAVTGQPK